MSSCSRREVIHCPKWDVKNPASAEGFTVIFNKGRDERKTSLNSTATGKTSLNSTATASPRRNDVGDLLPDVTCQYPIKSSKWCCCG